MAKCLASSNLGGSPNEYLYALADCDDGPLATIGSDDSLRLFDPENLTSLRNIPRCHDGVACLASGGPSHFITAGRDGLVRCWDARANQAAEMADPRSSGISSLACREQYIAVGTESTKEGLGDVNVLLFDARNPATPLRQYAESHADTVTQLAFHPTQPNVLLSGSTDGLISLFDLDQPDEEDALQQVLNPGSAVHCAGFLAPDQVYVVSTDEHFSIHNLATTTTTESGEDVPLSPPLDFGDVRARLQCMYVIDVLLQPEHDGPPLLAHGHNERQTLSISALASPAATPAWAFGETIDLPGAHGTDVVRDLLLPRRRHGSRAFTCGEDGNVRAWSLQS